MPPQSPAPGPKRPRRYIQDSKRQRLARPNFADRIQPEAMLRSLAIDPPALWPVPWAHAYSILTGEADLSDAHVRQMVQESATCALACARKVNQLMRSWYAFEMQKLFAKECHILGQCIERLPKSIRMKIDAFVFAELRGDIRDSETLLAVLRMIKKIYARQEKITAVRRAEQSIEQILHAREALDPFASSTLQEAFAGVKASEPHGIAAALFETLSERYKPGSTPNVWPLMTQPLIGSATELAQIWRDHVLRPFRARDDYNQDYQSRFQRFCDLILTPSLEPSAKRYPGVGQARSPSAPTPEEVSDHFKELRKKTRQAREKLDEKTRNEVGPGLQEQDWRFLISEHHIREALKAAPRIS